MAIVVLAAAAGALARRVAPAGLSAAPGSLRPPLPAFLSMQGALVTGAPQGLEPLLVQAVGQPAGHRWGWREPYAVAGELKTKFTWVRSVTFSRDWMHHKVQFRVEPHRAVARAVRAAKDLGWLSQDGTLFTVPPAAGYPDAAAAWPTVELDASSDFDLPALAQFLAAAQRPAALPSACSKVRYRSADDGWELLLADGTKVLWGKLSWTDGKLKRARQVYSDASRRFGAGFAVDLRYFEDGKVLVTPRGGAITKWAKPI